MGTRSLTIVRSNNKIKVAQYCQWDGYPTGKGKDIQEFLRENIFTLKDFKTKIDKCKFVSNKYIDRLQSKALGHNKEFITSIESDLLKTKLPEFHRDTGPKVLDLIKSGNVSRLWYDLQFIKDSVLCEWAYAIDLDLNQVTIFEAGMNKVYQDSIKNFIKLDLNKFENSLYSRE